SINLSYLILSSLYLISSFSHFVLLFFFFNSPPTTEFYTLSLHDALPIFVSDLADGRGGRPGRRGRDPLRRPQGRVHVQHRLRHRDRKSTRLNSSHVAISYAVFCLKKKKK